MVRAGAATLTTDVPLKLTAADSGHRLKIELHADQLPWCARATDTDGHGPIGTLVAAMTASWPLRNIRVIRLTDHSRFTHASITMQGTYTITVPTLAPSQSRS